MSNLSSFTHNDYEIIQREILYQGIFRLARYQLRHRTFQGHWSSPLSREILERPSAVAILPYDPVTDKVVLIEQFRAGSLSNAKSPWLLEVIAGIYDQNETPEQVASRESEEEAGCKILHLHPLYDYFVSPGGSNEYLHLFIGHVDARAVGGIHGLAEEHEDIRAFTLPAEDAFQLLESGQIKTSPAIIALQWLQLHRHKLTLLWQSK